MQRPQWRDFVCAHRGDMRAASLAYRPARLRYRASLDDRLKTKFTERVLALPEELQSRIMAHAMTISINGFTNIPANQTLQEPVKIGTISVSYSRIKFHKNTPNTQKDSCYGRKGTIDLKLGNETKKFVVDPGSPAWKLLFKKRMYGETNKKYKVDQILDRDTVLSIAKKAQKTITESPSYTVVGVSDSHLFVESSDGDHHTIQGDFRVPPSYYETEVQLYPGCSLLLTTEDTERKTIRYSDGKVDTGCWGVMLKKVNLQYDPKNSSR